ncbi:hypothetical protein C8J57DRAFT_142255 [Mycena rebaudengoi]|nr:hypothetical protein C8J57DRAFT_142255 [Mycena rebaudengoi]
MGFVGDKHPEPFHDPGAPGLPAHGTRLHSILAVTLVRRTAPSPLQVGHVLDLPWSEVREYLLPLAEFLEPPGLPEHDYSTFRISRPLRDLLTDPSHPETFVDPREWHAFVALWCLNRSYLNYDKRDIYYAADHWAYHVCNSRPSQDIWVALQRSPIPCRPISLPVLPHVIAWLKKIDVDATRELVAMYEAFYHRNKTTLRT